MYDLWVWRESVGWWLEEAACFSIDEAGMLAEELRKENATDPAKFGVAIVPTGQFQRLWGYPRA